jgi:hypothetical protein
MAVKDKGYRDVELPLNLQAGKASAADRGGAVQNPEKISNFHT